MANHNNTVLDLLAGEDDRIALTAPGKPDLTYKQLRRNVRELAAKLNGFGIGKGDRVSIAIPNSPGMVVTFLATATCATAAPLNPKYNREEFVFYYEDTNAVALIVLDEGIEAALAAVTPDILVIRATSNPDGTLSFEKINGIERSPRVEELAESDDIATILHTSGTTSRPKRVPIRHRNLAASVGNITSAYELSPADTTLCLMPLFHIHGLVGCLLSTFASGGTLVCPNGFNALEFWKLVDIYKPSWYSAAPTMHQAILSRASRNEAIVKANPFRFIRSSSAPLPPVIIEQMEATLNAPVLESYSMTEAAHLMATNPLPPKIRKPGTVGYGFGVDVAIMDEDGNLQERGQSGEVVVKGANVVDGYENNPEANAKAFTNGWFRTGDRGMLDEDGYLRLTGRLKELINRGGEKISPLEVDDILLRHPAVMEAIAFAVPHKMLGEDIHAAIVVTDKSITEQELKAYCSASLAEFKVPRQFHILDELPRGATGKLQRLNMAKLLNLTEG
ncbi:acyl--CoA ligase [Pseudanabaena sp. PCC 6802]|uniref:acyl--CoA ligase n=1 Tax=Pseudanabaena sp. PCC 6802 TaxID=118173 RepID=UPI00034CA3F0|nr:acyl--CoA ligase [Pseudanabaena sp. PCC 6802]